MYNQTIDNDFIESYYLLREYRNNMFEHMKMVFSDIDENKLRDLISIKISQTLDIPDMSLYNSYKDKTAKSNLLEFGNFIEKSEPILTPSGVIFQNHSKGVDSVLPNRFMYYTNERKQLKDKMFTFPEGTYERELYDLLQLLAKIDANALYGMMGLACSLVFNNDIAASVTLTGRGLISIAGTQIEMFLNNNVKYEDMNDIINAFDEVQRHTILNVGFLESNNVNITVEKCFEKILNSCINNISGWFPNDYDKNFILNYLNSFPQQVLNIFYYKNNLFEFIKLPKVKDIIIKMYMTLDKPYINPLEPPEEIKVDLDYLYSLIYDFVYYKNIINNAILKYSNMIRSVNIITDTDSCIVCFNNWYKLLCDIVSEAKMKPSAESIDYSTLVKGEVKAFSKYTFPKRFNFKEEKVEDNDILNDKPQLFTFENKDGHRFSLLNFGSYILGNIINDYVERYVDNCNAFITNEDKQCLMVLKNEFLMKNILLTDAKKLYASIIELREGSIENNKLDIKGLQMAKSTTNKKVRSELENLLYHLILNPDTIDYQEIINQLAVLKETLKESLRNKEKHYYNPKKIKSLSTYEDPYRTSGVKGMILWNLLKDDGQRSFDFNETNYADIAKIKINPQVMKEKYPDKYEILYNYLLEDNNFTKGDKIDKVISDITHITVPKDEIIPDFLIDFIDYNTIVDDNISKLPIEFIGIHKKPHTPFSNIVSL